MICEIIAIGTEVVTGNTLNTNAYFLAQALTDLGVEVEYHTSVDDDEKRLSKVFEIALERSDLIITSGGLGPTHDDITKDIIAKVLDIPMEEDKEAFEEIKKLFAKSGRVPTANNRKQAFKPKGAKFLNNPNGTAPGVYLEHGKKTVVLLPGPPRELNLMFTQEVAPLLRKDGKILIETIKTIGIGESSLETNILDLNLDTKFTQINTYAGNSGVEIKLIAKNGDLDKLTSEVNYIKKELENNLKEYIYSYGNITIEEYIVNELHRKNLKIGFAESCTGGLISSRITKVPGASNILERAIVTYSNQAKMDELKVKEETLKEYGAVSRQTAYEMAKGLLDKTDIDIALSVTGIAGPESDNTKKPVGLVYICIMDRKNHLIEECNFYGNREVIQNRSALKAFEMIRNYIVRND